MGDFVGFSEDIDTGMDYLEHFGIMGQRWHHRNGPPYPLSKGDHSSAEKEAAKAAHITIGSSSGKGSILKLKRFGGNSKSESTAPESAAKKTTQKKAPQKKELTPEEKRQAALEALRSGDKKKIAKYIDELSTDELREAQARAQMKDQLTKKDPTEQKASKADVEKQEAIRSGDKEKVKAYADKMTTQELRDAMDKVDLTTKLNKVDPPPSALDKLSDMMNKVDKMRDAAEKGVKAYNLLAQVYNSTHPNEKGWPEIHPKQQSKEQKKEEDALNKVANKFVKDATKDDENGQQKQKSNQNNNQQQNNKQNNNQQQDNQSKQNQQKQQNQNTTHDINIRVFTDSVNQVKDQKVNSNTDTPSYEELIPDDVRDVMNRKVG